MLICPGWPQSGRVFPTLITMSHFEQQVNMKLFCKLGRLAAGTFVSLNAIYVEKFLKILCTNNTTNLKWSPKFAQSGCKMSVG